VLLSTLGGLRGASGAAAPLEARGAWPPTIGGGCGVGGGDAAQEDNVNVVDATLKAFVDELPSEENIAQAAATADSSFELHPMWGPIHDTDQGAAVAKALSAGQGRFTVRQSAMRASEIAAKHQVFLHEPRADMLLAAVAYEVLYITDAERDEDNQLSVSVPRTGARILSTAKDAVRQVPHVDSRPHRMLGGSGEAAGPEEDDGPIVVDDPYTMRLSSYEMPQCRNFFMMAAGKDSFIFVTFPRSVLALARYEVGDGVRLSIYPETVTVPRNSVALVRSDKVHAGASAADDAARYGKAPAELNYSRSTRFHMYC